MYDLAFETNVLEQNIDLSIQLLTFWFLGHVIPTLKMRTVAWLPLSALAAFIVM